MSLTPEERAVLARRLDREIRVRFGGNKKRGYEGVVNPQTLQNLLDAQPVKPRSLVAVVNAWWPEAAGDWRAIPDLELPDEDLRGDVMRSDLPEGAKRRILDMLNQPDDPSPTRHHNRHADSA